MSPSHATIGPRRVIRGGVPRMSNMTFPVIVELPKLTNIAVETDTGAVGDTDLVDGALAGTPAEPVIDPALLEEARLEAAARGYADGLAAGRADAIAAARSEASALFARMEDAVCSFETKRQQSFDELTDGIARFAMATVEAILGRELELAANPTRDAIERALRVAPDRLATTVVVHPDDLELVGPIDDIVGSRTVELTTDPSIERGGSIVRAADSEVDAQLSGALERLRSVLGITQGDPQ